MRYVLLALAIAVGIALGPHVEPLTRRALGVIARRRLRLSAARRWLAGQRDWIVLALLVAAFAGALAVGTEQDAQRADARNPYTEVLDTTQPTTDTSAAAAYFAAPVRR